MPEPIRRGRPPKFGRPARLVAVTIPDDVRAWLESIDSDLGWALVRLFEQQRAATPVSAGRAAQPVAEVVLLTRHTGLIVVDPRVIPAVPGVTLIPWAENRAVPVLQEGGGLADLELAVGDALADARAPAVRAPLEQFLDRLRAWRRSGEWRFGPRAIVLAETRTNGTGRRAGAKDRRRSVARD